MSNNEIQTVQNIFGSPSVSGSRTIPSAAGNTDSSRAIAEVQASLMIAKINPRDQRLAVDRIINACTRPTLAESAIYCYPRGNGNRVDGPSIRLAEAIAQNWGNISFGIRELSNSNGKSEVQAFAWDMETNTRREVTFSVPHIRYTKKGSFQLQDPRDIYELVANQGARRLRACILAVIPGDVVELAVQQCKDTQNSSADTSKENIKKLIDTFARFGVSREQIEKYIGCRIEAIYPAQVIKLRNICYSMRDGMSTPTDWFEPIPTKEAQKQVEGTLVEKIKAKKQVKEAQQQITEDGVVSQDANGPELELTGTDN